MRLTRLLACASCLILLAAANAAADVTVFIGSNSSPTARAIKGAAIGGGVLVLGFEFEYATTAEDAAGGAPSLKTAMANGLLQAPFPIARMQPYFTLGVGGYRERLGTQQETAFAGNAGGGVKVTLIGPG
jgi:hypothetical protein